NFHMAMYYSYDISGNVKTLIHDLREVMGADFRFKRVDYEYDLYSGKVLLASYNRGHGDQFYQRYTYDGDNRLLSVSTSRDGLFWDRDAAYSYYAHGPLARQSLGEHRVQGIDYAYTLGGWLKAINGFSNGPMSDMGADGQIDGVMPRDVFSQRLDYFIGDYRPIGDSGFFTPLPATSKSLYNGNIAGVAKSLTPFSNLHGRYHYDALHRLDRAAYSDYSYSYSGSLLNYADLADWASQYRYDADGNLRSLSRSGGTVPAPLNPPTYVGIAQQDMDLLTYRYVPGSNRLRNVVDSSTVSDYGIGISGYRYTLVDRYTYDASGNMTEDVGSGLSGIQWAMSGKLRSLLRAAGSRMYFDYDPLGNRISKELVTYPDENALVRDKTFYVRDAAGHVLAVYRDEKVYNLERISCDLATDIRIRVVGGDIIPWQLIDCMAFRLVSEEQLG